jgi:hypothetical protein
MAVTPKAKPPLPPPARAKPERAKPERTSAVVTATLILLTVLGIVTVFWEPLAALAMGTPAADSVSAPGASEAAAAARAVGGALDASTNS